mmetsp:Transcript_80303/g.259489  ORF Transcript_80303/g.259489 Transcript_80303/m.259489 type:complete len:315 (+) Transcript_80303:125-1069(+)
MGADCWLCDSLSEAEAILGAWLKSRCIPRASVRLITKGGAGSQATRWAAALDEVTLEAELKVSLAALDVPYLDCYMLHRDDEAEDVGHIVRFLSGLVGRGFALSYGFSNWRFERVVAAAAFADAHGLPPPAAVGPQFSLARPARPVWPGSTFLASSQDIEWYNNRGLAVFCWEVLGKGMLADPTQWAEAEASAPRAADVEALEAAVAGGKDLGTDEAFRAFCVKGAYVTRENFARRRRALALAEGKGEPLARVAVSYVLAQGPRFFAILGPRSPAHFAECLPAAALSRDEVLNLEQDDGGGADARCSANLRSAL